MSVVLLGMLMLLALLPGGSRASSLPGPAYFSTGLVDDSAFQYATDPVRSVWLRRARHVGSSAVRIDVDWAAVAPRKLPLGFQASNPGDKNYDWTALDATVRTATADHQQVLLMLYQAPAWAEGPNRPLYVTPGAWTPNPRAYGEFAHAVALRYSGHFPDPLRRARRLPRVRDFQAWNEPNLPQFLMPQWVRGSQQSIVPASPDIYRSLLNALYDAVKAVQPNSYVVAAGTAPYGDPPGVFRMQPLVFLRQMLCLAPAPGPQTCPDPPHFDALDHHPYALTPTFHAHAGNVSVPDLHKIVHLLAVAQRAGHVFPLGRKSVWVTEIDWSTNPHVRTPVSVSLQAAYLSQTFYELWAQGISHVFWFDLRDPPGSVSTASGGGLYLGGGTPKPSAAAFRFPFVALGGPHGERTLWGKAPTTGTVVIQKLVGHRWQPALTLETTAGGIFYAHPRLDTRLPLRARIGKTVSPAWRTR